MNYLIEPFKKAFDFSGRSTRKQYWIFGLWMLLFAIICVTIDVLMGTDQYFGDNGLVGGIYSLFVLFPTIAISVRRLHDIGRTGTWVFISIIPIIGSLWLLVYFCTDSQSDNEYGPSLKYPSIQLSQDNGDMFHS